jgi:hypothetical protein
VARNEAGGIIWLIKRMKESREMLSTAEIVSAIKSGKAVMSCGNKVVAENIDFEWQSPELRVKLSNGASYPLEGKELRATKIID